MGCSQLLFGSLFSFRSFFLCVCLRFGTLCVRSLIIFIGYIIQHIVHTFCCVFHRNLGISRSRHSDIINRLFGLCVCLLSVNYFVFVFIHYLSISLLLIIVHHSLCNRRRHLLCHLCLHHLGLHGLIFFVTHNK